MSTLAGVGIGVVAGGGIGGLITKSIKGGLIGAGVGGLLGGIAGYFISKSSTTTTSSPIGAGQFTYLKDGKPVTDPSAISLLNGYLKAYTDGQNADGYYHGISDPTYNQSADQEMRTAYAQTFSWWGGIAGLPAPLAKGAGVGKQAANANASWGTLIGAILGTAVAPGVGTAAGATAGAAAGNQIK